MCACGLWICIWVKIIPIERTHKVFLHVFFPDNIDCDIPTMSKPKDPFTTEAVQSSKDKEVVLRAARNIVMVSYIMDGMTK